MPLSPLSFFVGVVSEVGGARSTSVAGDMVSVARRFLRSELPMSPLIWLGFSGIDALVTVVSFLATAAEPF